MTDPLYRLKRSLRLRDRVRPLMPVFDAVTALPTALSALHFYALKRVGLSELQLNRRVLDAIGIVPVRDHYYEPFFSARSLRQPLDQPRDLPGLDLRTEAACALLGHLGRWGEERLVGPIDSAPELTYEPFNGTYGLPDAAVLYGMLRALRPSRVVEVGGGNSTLVTLQALARNRADGAPCEHVCIEPFEMPWLERTGTTILRSIVQDVPMDPFEALENGDVLFIDNSHMIRPQGDVLHMVQRILPRLKPGVVVHIHDLFSPRDYPETWLLEKMLMWNEQYLVEAFLTCNDAFEVLVPSHHVYRDHRDVFNVLRPELAHEPKPHQVPTSFWIRRKPGRKKDPLAQLGVS
jgi:hypothetical protein